MNRTRPLRALRLGTATSALVASMVLTVGLGAAPSGAAHPPAFAGQSAFCKTILAVPHNPPKTNNYDSYQAWAKRWLPYWQRAASLAPNAPTRNAINSLVGVLKAEIRFKNGPALAAYVASHQVQWQRGWVAFSKALIQCTMSQL